MTTHRTEHAVRWTARMVVLPLLGLLAGLGAAGATTTQLTPRYEATSSVLVASTAKNSPAVTRLSDVSLAQNLAGSVAQLAQSRDVAVQTARDLGLPESDVVGHLTGESQIGIQIVKVHATSDSSYKAAALADSGASALITVSTRLHLGGNAVSVQPLDSAGVPTRASQPRPPLIYTLGAFVGLLVGIALLALRSRVGDRFRRVAEIESELDLPAIGVISRRVRRRRVRPARRTYESTDISTSVDGLVSALSVLVGRTPGRRIVVTGVGDEKSAAFVGVLLALGIQRQDGLTHHRPTTLLEGKLRAPVAHRYFPGEETPVVTAVLSARKLDEAGPPQQLAVLTTDAVTEYFDRDPSFEQVGALIDALAENGGDVVVIAPSVLAGRGLAEVARHADAVILTVDSDRTPRADAGRAAMLVQRLGVGLAAVVVTGSAAEEDGWQPAVWPTLRTDRAPGPGRAAPLPQPSTETPAS